MNIIAFPVNMMNIFPAANTTTGGQLVTEYNLLSRESVATDRNVTYRIGPSYCHSMDDFEVSLPSTSSGEYTSSAVLFISPGRALVNGYYIESLTTISIDIAEQNMENGDSISGRLCIGLRAMYSTESTIAGAIKVENTNDMFEGIQVVILPEAEFKLPSDVPNEPESVTAHLKLATFTYNDSKISNLVNNDSRCSVIDAWRINNVDELLTKTYLSKAGLNPKKFYTYAGKGKTSEDIKNGVDTWCDSTDALMVFDSNPQAATYGEYVKVAKNRGLTVSGETTSNQVEYLTNQYQEAVFTELDTEQIALVLPHKQIDGGMTSQDGSPQLYPPKVYTLPVADFTNNTAGTVDSTYTKKVKEITSKIEELYNLPAGKQRGYVAELTTTEQGTDDGYLPYLNQNWDVGDYILVGKDNTITISETTYTQQPSSIYVVLPPRVKAVKYVGMLEGLTSETVNTECCEYSKLPEINKNDSIKFGRMLGQVDWSDIDDDENATPNTTDPSTYNEYFTFSDDSVESDYAIRGKINEDYFVIDVYETCTVLGTLDSTNDLPSESNAEICSSTDNFPNPGIVIATLDSTSDLPGESTKSSTYLGEISKSTDIKTIGSIEHSYQLPNSNAIVATLYKDGVAGFIQSTDDLPEFEATIENLPSSGQTLNDEYVINGEVWRYTGVSTEDNAESVNGFEKQGSIVNKVYVDMNDYTIWIYNDSDFSYLTYGDCVEFVDESGIYAYLPGKSVDTDSLVNAFNELTIGDCYCITNDTDDTSDDEWWIYTGTGSASGFKKLTLGDWFTVTSGVFDSYSVYTKIPTTEYINGAFTTLNEGDCYSVDNIIYKYTDNGFEALSSKSYYKITSGDDAGMWVYTGSSVEDENNINGFKKLSKGDYYLVTNDSDGDGNGGELWYYTGEATYNGVTTVHGFIQDIYSTLDGQKCDIDSGLALFDRYYYAVSNGTNGCDCGCDNCTCDSEISTGEKEYSSAIWLTDEIPLAETDRIGGFLNVDESALDAGYIIRDDEGHLKLLDYSLLRTGTLAYQLGEDFESSSGLTLEALQDELDEYVNERIAFLNSVQKTRVLAGEALENEINVIIHITEPTDEELEAAGDTGLTLDIYGIDSRFGTYVNLQILGAATSDVTINIVNCEKIRIDSTISGNPVINLYNSNLYYDTNVLNKLAYGTIENLSLWYCKRTTSDTDLHIDGMTVSGGTGGTVDTSDYDDKFLEGQNDIHYAYKLKSITFGSDGIITECGLYVTNSTSANASEGKKISAFAFAIPNGGTLSYPSNLLQRQIKITGNFVSAYLSSNSETTWVVMLTNFSALSQLCSKDDDTNSFSQTTDGTIVFLTDVSYIDSTVAYEITSTDGSTTQTATSIDAWEPGAYHIFNGSTLS